MNDCDLCDLAVITRLHHRDEHLVCVNSLKRKIPMWVAVNHTNVFPQSMRNYIRMKSIQLFGTDVTFNWPMNSKHKHAHVYVVKKDE